MKHFTKQLLGVSGVLLLLVLGASPGAFAQTPDPPQNLTAVAEGDSVKLSWTKSTNALSYRILRAGDNDDGEIPDDASSEWESIGSVDKDDDKYTDGTGVGNGGYGTRYHYRIVAVGAGFNESDVSNTVSVRTGSTTFITVTTTAISVEGQEITLNWERLATPASVVVVGYEIQRSEDGGKKWMSLVKVGPETFEHEDKNLKVATTYHYQVRAAHSSTSFSAWSQTVMHGTQPPRRACPAD